ncbi:MAG: hypothetical protein ACP5JJ_15395, partial [Anaerolineae bacterium]
MDVPARLGLSSGCTDDKQADRRKTEMNIGIPKERRDLEKRVGLTPYGVDLLTRAGHICYIETKAGLGAGFT